MKLINISRSDDSYVVKVLHPVKILGLQVMSYVRLYSLIDNEEEWKELKSKKKVSKLKNLKLNKWLRDHQKFIEKT